MITMFAGIATGVFVTVAAIIAITRRIQLKCNEDEAKELEKLRIDHYDSGDWRLCPVLLDDTGLNKCDCGADEHNAQLDKIIKHLEIK